MSMSRITGLGGGRKSKQLESAALFEARIVSGLMKRAIKKMKIVQPSWLK